jgi:hypothetical protein
MSDADCLLETLVQVLHRYHPSASETDLKLRHHSDVDVLLIIKERVDRWNIDLAKRGSRCEFWIKVSTALAGISKRQINFEALPETLLLEVSDQPRGFLLADFERADAVRLVNGIPTDNQTGKFETLGKLMTNPFRSPHRG